MLRWTAASTVFPASGNTIWSGKSFCNRAVSRRCGFGIHICGGKRSTTPLSHARGSLTFPHAPSARKRCRRCRSATAVQTGSLPRVHLMHVGLAKVAAVMKGLPRIFPVLLCRAALAAPHVFTNALAAPSNSVAATVSPLKPPQVMNACLASAGKEMIRLTSDATISCGGGQPAQLQPRGETLRGIGHCPAAPR
jgi:hypothetical protein